MEHPSQNRYAWLLDSTPELANMPSPTEQISLSTAAAMEAIVAETYIPTPEPPLPTNPLDDSLNNSTLVPTHTPEGMVAIAIDSSPPSEALVASPATSPTPQLITEGAALAITLENADNNLQYAQGIEVSLYMVAPVAPTTIRVSPMELDPTPSPDTIFERKAVALYDAWIALIGRMNPKKFEELQVEYSANQVGNPHIWLLSCWLHRAPSAKVLEFLRAHSPPTSIIEALQHAFATRLTRLRGHIADHSKHADTVRSALEDWNNGAMREAVPSPITWMMPGNASAPISVSSSDNSSVVLIQPRELAAFERAQRRATCSQAPVAPPPLSRRPSVSLSDMAEAAPQNMAEDDGSDSSTTPTSAKPPWTHAIPKEDWPSEWGSHTPSSHSLIAGGSDGHHPRHPIILDTPSPSLHTPFSTKSPPEDMGRPDPKGKMSSAARATLNELRLLSKQAPPTQAAVEGIVDASTDEASDWANIWADTIAPMQEGYARYALRDPIPLLKGGNRIEPAHALDTAFRVVVAAIGAGFDKPGSPQDRTLGSGHWFRGVSAVMGATLRGMLISQGFFD
ncbi:hypothetical protein EDB85DRAFT_2150723 [Lactarius pseudohatsudake]|nr:hypothetical protein EDB85DRAFT_2150723 [Lactarius pseudohatsudake]